MLNTIYMLRNRANNKVYVGQTWQTLKNRWNNGRGYWDCYYINNAIQKYGEDTFYYEILTFCSTQEAADYWEDFFIRKYDSCNSEYGYNLKYGGSRGIDSEETKRKKSERMKGENNPMYGREYSDEERQRISENTKGEKNPFFGKQHSEETKRKLSEINTGKPGTFLGKHHTEETKRILSEINSGENSPWFGRTHSEETLKKMSASAKKRVRRVGWKLSKERKEKTSGENNGLAKLNWQIVGEIRSKYATGNHSQRQLAKEYGVAKSTIQALLKNETWKI